MVCSGMVGPRSPLQDAPATAPVLADVVKVAHALAPTDMTDAARGEAWANFEAMKPAGDWEPTSGYYRFVPLTPSEEERLRAKPRLIPSAPHHAHERSAFGAPVEPDPEASQLRAVLPALPGTTVMLPCDIPVPPSWRDPARMTAAVEEAVKALRKNRDAAQGPRITIFRALSRLTDLGKPLSPELLDALARGLGLGVAGKVVRRDESKKVQDNERYYDHSESKWEGETNADLAAWLGVSPRTVRRRKTADSTPKVWRAADGGIVAFEEWDPETRVLFYDACLWHADKARPIPVRLWWDAARAFGLAKGEHGTGCFTDKAISAIWNVPTTRPDILPEAAMLRASAVSLSNRALAAKLGVDDGVVNRLASAKNHRNADTGLSVLAHAAWTQKLWARWRAKA